MKINIRGRRAYLYRRRWIRASQDLPVAHPIEDYLGAIPTDARVVEHGKVITSAGVSAGIDMSLVLVERIMGTEYAQAAQLDMEYDPAPPFDAGHPRSAPPAVTAWLKGMYDDMLGG